MIPSSSLESETGPTPTRERPAGLYIHIPFCRKKCPYCDFYSQTDLSQKGPYLSALMTEMTLTKNQAPSFDSIYIGGGTPSLLTADEVDRLLSSACSAYRVHPTAEVTLEVNPGTTNARALKGYLQAGVNRISVGVQSFNDRWLKKLGRIHTAKTAIQCLKAVMEAGYPMVGIDLIYGLPGQKRDEWEKDLDHAVRFLPQHISCYMLTYETGTPFDNQRQAGRLIPLKDSTIADMYKTTTLVLERHGYRQYEISNFALPGARSRHNMKYWNNAFYLGLGASAHTYDGLCRSWNVKNSDHYIRLLADGRRPISGEEHLTGSQQMLEAIYLGLRTNAGIDIKDFDRRFGGSFNGQCAKLIAEFRDQGIVQNRPNRVALTVEGMLLLDTIVTRISDQMGDGGNRHNDHMDA